jgi:hypothetical protein
MADRKLAHSRITYASPVASSPPSLASSWWSAAGLVLVGAGFGLALALSLP